MTAAPHSQSFRVLMAGPLPPSIGGMTTVICELRDSRLRDEVTLDLFDTAKRTPEGRSLWMAIGARLSLWRRWCALLRARPRVAHIHTCSGLSYFLDGALVLLARALRVPVVLHVHGGRFDKFLDDLDTVRRWLARHIARRAACVIVVSDLWRKRLATRLPGACLRVVENGVPMPAETGRRAAGEESLVVFVGAICRAKGVEELVRAATRLHRRCRVVLLGPETEDGLTDRLRRLATELGLASRVELTGPVSSTERADWLARATVFVLPSHVEALPMAVLEAMAAGCPVVATEVGALPTVIRHDVNGLLVPPGDVDALAAAMNRLLVDAALRDRFADEARRAIRERFSIDRIVDELHRIYAEVCRPTCDSLLPAHREPAVAWAEQTVSEMPNRFESDWRRRFERYAGTHDDEAGIAGWSEGGLAARYRRFVYLFERDGSWRGAGRWLDAGCGAGTYSRYLVGHGLKLAAVDYSVPTTQKARARIEGDVLWATADVTQLPFADGEFDGALCFGVMQALGSSERALRELHRVVRPGGVLWVDILNAYCLPSWLGEWRRRLQGRARHLRYDQPAAFRAALRAVGFADLTIAYVPILPTRWRKFQPWIESAGIRGLFRILPPLGLALSHSILVRARVP